eukprot:12892255-Prorocentrum_lima.AAC.1
MLPDGRARHHQGVHWSREGPARPVVQFQCICQQLGGNSAAVRSLRRASGAQLGWLVGCVRDGAYHVAAGE